MISKTAMITICGRPNVGKSTLTNALAGEKIAIVSNKPQTTRNRITAVCQRGETQFVFLDTPGFHKPRTRLGDYMVNVVRQSVADVDAVVLVVEPVASLGPQERELIASIKAANCPAVLAINKLDTVEPEKLLAVIALYSEAYAFNAIVPISAKTGDGVAELAMSDRFTICNMAIEAGGKNGIFPVDEKTIAYLNGRVSRQWTAVTADADAVYDRVITIKLDDLVPVVSYPHLPENTHPAFESGHIKIDQVVVGSCTNGRLEDLQQAAEVMQGRKVHPHVRAIIIPATQEIYKEAMRLGYIDTFIDAGAAVSTPTCGPCLGGYMGILAAGERAVSTTNRNFRGRMGHVDSEVYLASPYVAAASAITGYIASPEEVMK